MPYDGFFKFPYYLPKYTCLSVYLIMIKKKILKTSKSLRENIQLCNIPDDDCQPC